MNTLPEHRIDLWYQAIPPSAQVEIPGWPALLNAAEKDQFAAFHFDHDRRRFLLTRVLVRSVLAAYLPTPAKDLVFCHNDFGRPSLLPEQNPLGLDFNLSHTGQGIVCALACRARIGVDLESYTKSRNPEIAETFFTDREKAQLHTVPQARWNRQFIELWALKEAYIKALGKGTAIPLDSFYFELHSEHIEFVDLENGEDNAAWHFRVLEAPDEQVLSVGVCFEHPSQGMPQINIHTCNLSTLQPD